MLTKPAYRPDELEKEWPLGRTKIFEAIRKGELKARKVGRATIILREDALDYLQKLPAWRPGAPVE